MNDFAVFPSTEPELLYLSRYCESGIVLDAFPLLAYLILTKAL